MKTTLLALVLSSAVLANAGEFFPFVISYDSPDNAANFSALLDAPAGKHGRVFVKDGHFATAKGPIRFNATNLTGPGNLLEKPVADRLADRLARFGINCVRLHFLDCDAYTTAYGNKMLPPRPGLLKSKGKGGPLNFEIDLAQLDKLEYLIAALKRRGIYVNVNLHVARIQGHKGLTWLERDTIESEKRYARELLTHKNPYTGLSLAEDPVVAMIELVNEDSPFTQQHKALEAGTRGFAKVILQRENAFLEEMKALIHGELACPAPITGSQLCFDSPFGHEPADYYDEHSYWCHPHALKKDRREWVTENIPQVNCPTSDWNMASIAARRVEGRPFTVSEYNNPYPNFCGTEGQLLYHAYGAYQDWDGVYQYTYNCCPNEPDHVEYFFSMVARTDVLAHMPACAALYLRGDVRPAGRAIRVGTTRDAYLTRYVKDHVVPDDVTRASRGKVPQGAGLLARLALVLDGAEKASAELPKDNVFRSDTDEIEWNCSVPDAGFVAVRTPNTKVFTGFVRGRAFDLGGGVRLALGKTLRDWATVSLVSKDATGFGEKGKARILVAATGQAQNGGAMFTEHPQADGKVFISSRDADWGSGPFEVEGVPATLTLPAAKARAWALDEHGNRKAEVPVSAADGASSVKLDPSFKTVWYEIETEVR